MLFEKLIFWIQTKIFGKNTHDYSDSNFEVDVRPSIDMFHMNPNDFVGPTIHTQSTDLTFSIPVLTDVVLDVVAWATKWFITSAGTAAGKEISNELFGSTVTTQFAQIIESLSVIEKKLDLLIQLYHNTTYEKYINDRTQMTHEMINNSREYLDRLKEVIDNNGTDEEIFKILSEWADSTVGGNKARNLFMNFIDFILNVKVEQMTLYKIYDLYVYNTTPWESMGYEMRDNLRLIDIATISREAMLAMMYYKYRTDISDEIRNKQIAEISAKMKSYLDYYTEHQVEHHNDLAICQIPNAHIIMKKQLEYRDYYTMSWFPKGTKWDFENAESAWVVLWGPDCYNNCEKSLTEKEFNAIVNYYKNKDGYSTFADILNKDAGISAKCTYGKTMYLQLQSQAYTDREEYNDYGIYTYNACAINTGMTQGRTKIGTAWLKACGFLWLENKFERWASLDNNHLWYLTNIVNRY